MKKKRIYFITSSIIQILLSLYSFFNAETIRQTIINNAQSLYGNLSDKVISTFSNTSIIPAMSGVCTILGLVILIIAIKDKLSSKKTLVLILSIASILCSIQDLIIVLMIVNIILILKTKKTKESVRKNTNKKITVLDRCDLSNKCLVSGIIVAAVYFLLMLFPDILPIPKGYLKAIIVHLFILIVCLVLFKDHLKRDFYAFRVNFKSYMSYIFPKLGIMYLFYISANIIASVVLKLGNSVNQQNIEAMPFWFTIPLAVVWAPIVEEIVFRGCFRRLIKNDKVFVIVSALIFGMVHTMSEASLISFVFLTIPYSILGGFLAYIYTKTNNICSNMFCHSFHNALAMGILLLSSLLG